MFLFQPDLTLGIASAYHHPVGSPNQTSLRGLYTITIQLVCNLLVGTFRIGHLIMLFYQIHLEIPADFFIFSTFIIVFCVRCLASLVNRRVTRYRGDCNCLYNKELCACAFSYFHRSTSRLGFIPHYSNRFASSVNNRHSFHSYLPSASTASLRPLARAMYNGVWPALFLALVSAPSVISISTSALALR